MGKRQQKVVKLFRKKDQFQKNVGRIGDGIKLMATLETERQVHELEEIMLIIGKYSSTWNQ